MFEFLAFAHKQGLQCQRATALVHDDNSASAGSGLSCWILMQIREGALLGPFQQRQLTIWTRSIRVEPSLYYIESTTVHEQIIPNRTKYCLLSCLVGLICIDRLVYSYSSPCSYQARATLLTLHNLASLCHPWLPLEVFRYYSPQHDQKLVERSAVRLLTSAVHICNVWHGQTLT